MAANLLKDQQFGEHLTNLEIVNDLPKGLLSSMMKQESGGNPNAVSNKGAQGAFQFIPSTAKMYGVDVTDPYSSADGAARYMADNLKKYKGSVEASLADYNGGPRQAKAVIETGTPKALETKGYIRNILAAMNPIGTANAAEQPLKNTTPTGYNKPANTGAGREPTDEEAIAWLDAQKATKPVQRTPTDDEAIAWLDAQKAAKPVQRTPEQIAASQQAKAELAKPAEEPGFVDRLKNSVSNAVDVATNPVGAVARKLGFNDFSDGTDNFRKGVVQSGADTLGGLGYGAAKVSDAVGLTDNHAATMSDSNKYIENNYQNDTKGSIPAGLGSVAGTVGQIALAPAVEAPAIIAKAATAFPKAAELAANYPMAARIAQNAALGAGFGAAGTKTDDESYLQNAAVGAVAGPVLGEGVNLIAKPLGSAVQKGYQSLADKMAEFNMKPSAANVVAATEDSPWLLKKGVEWLNDSSLSGNKANRDAQKAVVEQINKPIDVTSKTLNRENYYNLENPYAAYDTAVKDIPVKFEPAKGNVVDKLTNDYSNISADPNRSVLSTLERAGENYKPDPATNFPRSLKAPEVDRMVKDVALARDSTAGEAGTALEGVRKLYTDTLHQGIGADNVKLLENAKAVFDRQQLAKVVAERTNGKDITAPTLLSVTKKEPIPELGQATPNIDVPPNIRELADVLTKAKLLQKSTNPFNQFMPYLKLGGKAVSLAHPGLAATMAAGEGANMALQSNRSGIARALTGNTKLQQSINNNTTSKAAIMAALLANRIKNNK